MLNPFYTWENWGSERKSELPRVTQRFSRSGITWISNLPSPPNHVASQEERFVSRSFLLGRKAPLVRHCRVCSHVLRSICDWNRIWLVCASPCCCDTLLLSRMPHLRFCQKFPYRAANGSSRFSSPSKTETSLSFFENQLPMLILIVGDAANHRVGDFQNVVGQLL